MKRSLLLFLLATNAYGYNPATREQQVEQTTLLNDIKTNTAGGGGGGGNNSVGSNGAAAPAYSTQLGFTLTGNLVPVSAANPLPISGSISATNPSVSATGSAVPAQATMIGGTDGTNLRALSTNSSGVLALPQGASTSANQTTANSSLSSIDGKTPALSGGRVPVDGSGVTQPISAAALPLPTGAATETTLSSINGKTATLVSGRVPVDGSAVTQPVSASSLPLPTGAATATLQSDGNTTLADIENKLNVDYGPMGGAIRTNSQIGNENGPADFNRDVATGQTLRVTVATDDTINVVPANGQPGETIYYDYADEGPISPGSPLTIVNTTADMRHLHIFDSSGHTVMLNVGGVDAFIIAPGGPSAVVDLFIPAGTDLTVAPLDGTDITSGILVITGLD